MPTKTHGLESLEVKALLRYLKEVESVLDILEVLNGLENKFTSYPRHVRDRPAYRRLSPFHLIKTGKTNEPI